LKMLLLGVVWVGSTLKVLPATHVLPEEPAETLESSGVAG
jgi:hypothetical protein